MNSRKGLGVTALTVAWLLTFAGCSGAPAGGPTPDAGEGDGSLKVGMLVKGLATDFWQQVVAGADAAADEIGDVEVLEYAPDSESNVDQQINQVETLIAQNVDAIVIAPVAPDQLKPALERAVAAGIPVVVLDTRVEGFEDQQSAYVGADNRSAGAQAGKLIIDQLGGEGTVGLVNGTPGVPAVEDRLAGVRDVVKGTSVEVVGETAAVDCTTDNGVKAAEDLLSANPGLDAMFVACGPAAVGAQQAIKSAGIDWANFVLVGFDAAPDELTSIAAGEERGTVAQDTHAMGGESLKAAVKAARGETINNPNVDPGVLVITKENVDQFLK